MSADVPDRLPSNGRKVRGVSVTGSMASETRPVNPGRRKDNYRPSGEVVSSHCHDPLVCLELFQKATKGTQIS